MARSAAQPIPADRVRQASVLAAAVVALAGAVVGSGAAGGTPIPTVAGGALGPDATPVAPAGPAFSIWSVIYLGLAVYAIWQALPTQAARPRQRRIGYWMLASLLLNAAWILCVQFDRLGLSVVMIAALLVVLIVAFAILRATQPESTFEKVVLDGTVGLYLGWVMVATVAGVAAFIVSAEGGALADPLSGGAGWNPHAVAMVVLPGVAVLGSALAIWDRGRLAPAVAAAWGLAWIGVARLTGSLVSLPTALTAFAAAMLVLMVAVAVRVARTPVHA
jgi:tryptophan-rich sensory protein